MPDHTHAIKELDDILSLYGMEEARENWIDGWAESAVIFSRDALTFLDASYIDRQCRFLSMSDEMRHAVFEARALFERHPALKRLLWHCHHTAFRQPAPLSPAAFRWSAIPPEVDTAAPIFYIYLFLSGVPYTVQIHERNRIPKEITVDTLRDLLVWIDDYRAKNDEWGLHHNQVGWFGLHFTGRLYQLGRLQFELSRHRYDFRAFRHRESGRVVLLAGDGMRFRADGQMFNADGVEDPGAWTASLDETETSVTGYIIDPHGYATLKMVELFKRDWQPVLKRDDTTIGVHIPATGRMDFDACGVSFRRATPFFQTYFPDYNVHALTCSSWLLDPQFESALGADSNIARFLREWYLTPIPRANGRETLRRVFGAADVDIESLPQKTSLQRAVVRHVRRGGRWRGSGGVMFPHNMDWGRQVYRRDYRDEMRSQP